MTVRYFAVLRECISVKYKSAKYAYIWFCFESGPDTKPSGNRYYYYRLVLNFAIIRFAQVYIHLDPPRRFCVFRYINDNYGPRDINRSFHKS